MSNSEGLVFAYCLDGTGGGSEIGWDEVRAWQPDASAMWIHLDYQHPDAQHWIEAESGIDPIVGQALLAEETRPRCVNLHDGLMLILRGVNLNPGAEPSDMISIRLWLEGNRIVTMRHRHVMAIQDLRETVAAGDGPIDAGDFLVQLCDRLLTRMAPILEALDDSVDAVEDEILTGESYELRSKIGAMRRQAISMRRYLAPQREVIARLQGERVSWLNDLQRSRLREISDRITRYVEDLDAARDRAAVTQEELSSRLSEQMNKTMYVLSIVAAIFLPLGLLTGLLGINVGGIPGGENKWAFLIVCLFLIVIATIQIWIFRRRRWL
jgi:zinc transporter